MRLILRRDTNYSIHPTRSFGVIDLVLRTGRSRLDEDRWSGDIDRVWQQFEGVVVTGDWGYQSPEHTGEVNRWRA